MRFLESLKIASNSRAWIILCLIHFAELFFYSMRTQGVMYYSKYYMGNESLEAVFLTMTQSVTLAVALIMPRLSEKIGNRRCVFWGNLIWCIALAGNLLAGHSIPLILLFHFLSSIGWAVASGIMFVMISETVDYSERATGYRLDGFITSTVVLVMKLGTALAGAVSSRVLLLGGYVADGRMTQNINNSIMLNYIGIPLLISAAVMALIHFYPVQNSDITS